MNIARVRATMVYRTATFESWSKRKGYNDFN